MVIQLKMRPIFSRGNSVASFNVAPGNKEQPPLPTNEECEAPSTSQSRPRGRRRRGEVLQLHVSFADPSVVTAEYPAPDEPITDKELKAYFYSVRFLR
jgi:hypothetical protein